jgi:hypothetical protein
MKNLTDKQYQEKNKARKWGDIKIYPGERDSKAMGKVTCAERNLVTEMNWSEIKLLNLHYISPTGK